MTTSTGQGMNDEARQRLAALLELENEVMYVIEALSEDYRGEASRGMKDAFECVKKLDLPENWIDQMIDMLNEAVDPINQRDLVTCSRKLQNLRRRLANEAALMLGQKNPYAYCYYPTFTPIEQEAGQ